MNFYMARFSQPWPLVQGQASERVIVQARNLTRALEMASQLGAVLEIGPSSLPVVVGTEEGK